MEFPRLQCARSFLFPHLQEKGLAFSNGFIVQTHLHAHTAQCRLRSYCKIWFLLIYHRAVISGLFWFGSSGPQAIRSIYCSVRGMANTHQRKGVQPIPRYVHVPLAAMRFSNGHCDTVIRFVTRIEVLSVQLRKGKLNYTSSMVMCQLGVKCLFTCGGAE